MQPNQPQRMLLQQIHCPRIARWTATWTGRLQNNHALVLAWQTETLQILSLRIVLKPLPSNPRRNILCSNLSQPQGRFLALVQRVWRWQTISTVERDTEREFELQGLARSQVKSGSLRPHFPAAGKEFREVGSVLGIMRVLPGIEEIKKFPKLLELCRPTNTTASQQGYWTFIHWPFNHLETRKRSILKMDFCSSRYLVNSPGNNDLSRHIKKSKSPDQYNGVVYPYQYILSASMCWQS